MCLASTLGLELVGSQVALVEVTNARDAFGAWARRGAAEEQRSFDDFPCLELPVLDNDLAVKEWDKERSDNDGDTSSDTKRDTDGLGIGELDLG